MTHYKHILLTTDLSEDSHAIGKKAGMLAKKMDAQLNLVHVLEHSPIAYASDFSIPIDINLEQLIETQARTALKKLADSLKIPDSHIHFEEGSVRDSVIHLASKLKVDLILVGAHSHKGLDRLLGSHAMTILHHAHCDVLAIRGD